MARLIWTEPALEDLGRIADYVALDDPVAAKRLVSRVFREVGLLQDFPEMAPVARDLPDSRYRQLLVRPLRIFYRLQSDSVIIVHVMRSERLVRTSDIADHDPSAGEG